MKTRDEDTSSPNACMERCMLWIRSGLWTSTTMTTNIQEPTKTRKQNKQSKTYEDARRWHEQPKRSYGKVQAVDHQVWTSTTMTNTQEPTKQTGTVEDVCEDDDTSSPSACMARCMLWIRSGQDIDDRYDETHMMMYGEKNQIRAPGRWIACLAEGNSWSAVHV